jgi:NADH:ubiquinone oxidoreductase subunit C
MKSLHILEVSVPRARRIFVRADKEYLKDVIQFLKNEGFMHLSAITGLETNDVIELLYHLSKEGILLTVQVKLPLNEITAPTITDIILGALLYEREIHDLFGVKFEGHPNLEPLILPEDWPKDVYPLRKSGTTKEGKLKKKQKHSRTNI